jgi:hypothetical protein
MAIPINDPAFSRAMAERMDAMYKAWAAPKVTVAGGRA